MLIFALDTMKDSRDSHTLSQKQIDDHVDICAWLKPTHIAIDCFMDWPEYFRGWVSSIRRYNIPIIHRLKWWGWEYPQDGNVTPDEFVDKTKTFIRENADCFQDGDIIDGCAEQEVGPYWDLTYGDGWLAGGDKSAALNGMLARLLTEIPALCVELGKDIIANHVSHMPNSFFSWITEENVMRHKWIAYDNYIESDYLVFAEGKAARLAQLEELHSLYPTMPIFLSEWGYHLQGCSDADQAHGIQTMLKAFSGLSYVDGICYWVVCGYEKHTDVISRADINDIWVQREAAKTVASFFANKGRVGRVPIAQTVTAGDG